MLDGVEWYWKVLGGIWKVLVDVERQVLESVGRYWHVSVCAGRCWQVLASVDRCMHVLAGVGWCLKVLADVGRY